VGIFLFFVSETVSVPFIFHHLISTITSLSPQAPSLTQPKGIFTQFVLIKDKDERSASTGESRKKETLKLSLPGNFSPKSEWD